MKVFTLSAGVSWSLRQTGAIWGMMITAEFEFDSVLLSPRSKQHDSGTTN